MMLVTYAHLQKTLAIGVHSTEEPSISPLLDRPFGKWVPLTSVVIAVTQIISQRRWVYLRLPR